MESPPDGGCDDSVFAENPLCVVMNCFNWHLACCGSFSICPTPISWIFNRVFCCLCFCHTDHDFDPMNTVIF